MGHYAHPEAAETRVRRALAYQIKQITKANGYNNDIVDVYERIPTRNGIASFPCVIPIFGKEDVLNSDQSDQAWHLDVPIVLLACISDADDPVLGRASIKLDIKRHFGHNFGLQDETGVEQAFLMRYTGSEDFGMLLNEPRVGVAIGYRIQWREDILDPSVTT